MNDRSASDTLILALPVLLVLLALIGAVIFFPQGSILDIRGQAAPLTVAPTRVPVPTPNAIPTFVYRPPEAVCPDLYKPVCDTKTNITYASACDAKIAGVTVTRNGVCSKPLVSGSVTPAVLPSAY